MPCTEGSLTSWQAFACPPGRYDDPSQLADEWPTSRDVDVPATVATVFGADQDPDDFDWWFRTVVEADETTAIDFRGITFPATVFIDGVEVAQSQSMFLPLAVECTVGVHEICVRFQSLTAWLTVRRPRGRWRSSLVASPGMRWVRTTLIGRAPIYGPLPAPVGFWRPVVTTPARRVTTCSIRTDPSNGNVRLTGSCGADDGTDVTASITDAAGDVVAESGGHVGGNAFSLHAVVPEPRLWWPRGYGEPTVYRMTLDVDGEPVGRRILGFRHLAVDRRDAGFHIRVNDVPIFCRGATWTPPDPVGLHVDRRTIAELITTFADAGANTLRIVGGMVYEQDEFWELCAEMGVMVWQDAMQSTFDPPPEQSELIADELAGVLDAVSGNPALTVVSGGSETLQRPEMLGLDASSRTIPLIEAVLPERVRQHSDALYVPATPSPPPGSNDLAIRPDTGVAHWFGVGGYLRPIADVRSASVKFAAECLAFANPPVAAAVERHFGSAAVAGHDPRWKAGVPRDRGASWDFEDVRDHYAVQVFGEDLLATRRVDPERYLQLGRLAVAQAMRECFAFWRRSDSGCSGALVLTGKDTCPGAGWGLLDVDGTPKPALAVLRRVWAPVAVVISDGGLAGLRVDVHNDTDRMVSGPLTLSACRAEGNRIDATMDVVIPPHSSVTTTDAEVTGAFRDLSYAFRFGPATADAVEVVFAYAGGEASVRDAIVVEPRGGQLAANVKATLAPEGDDRWTLDVESRASLRYVCLDVAGWEPSDDYFHLPAASARRVTLRRNTATGAPAGTLHSIDLLTATRFGT